ncbi:hypothetical protein [Nannocystis pusilla]|uniref:hypothetical protein n=1 Tax=Nannocystis pusilla TaxID=889268 RepID=UPI003B773F43
MHCDEHGLLRHRQGHRHGRDDVDDDEHDDRRDDDDDRPDDRGDDDDGRRDRCDDGARDDDADHHRRDGDPDYHRECQPGDFVCDGDIGCEDATLPDECYKPCTPDGEVGAPDGECDEPERPFCSQVGLADGGDFSCNSCVHICMAEPQNQCDFGADECP